MADLSRLLSPRAVAVIGGGTWCENVIRECRGLGFSEAIWPIHPTRDEVGGLPAYPGVDQLPGIPDAAFIGVNRALTVEIVGQLSDLGCGGAVCFAAGFREAAAELADGESLQGQLVAAAAEMPILGPNCYGFVNALDGVALWPDMHGLRPVERGVAVIGQSSNVLINLTMQRRGLPLAAVIAAGNQAQVSMADAGITLLEDSRITALGLHIEGITDLRSFEALARRARELDKPIVALRVGASQQAQEAAVSHTASLTGSDAGARALLSRLSIAQVNTAAELIETLKVLHVTGGLPSPRIASASCSGGEAALMADLGQAAGVEFPALDERQKSDLRKVLGSRVALANPLDYNTYIWGDEAALTACFTALCQGDIALGCVVIDFPRADRFEALDWDKVVRAVAATRLATGKPMALLSLLPEGIPEDVAEQAIAQGLLPLCGMGEAMAAIRAAATTTRHEDTPPPPLLIPRDGSPARIRVYSEAEAKSLLTEAGLRIPGSGRAHSPEKAAIEAERIGFPVVLKGEGIAHKTEMGAVVLNLGSADAVRQAAEGMPATSFLVEQMISGGIAELLIGVTHDPAHGFVLTIGLGGILTELLADTVSLLLPVSEQDIREALGRLRCGDLLTGYRGRAAADLDAVIAAIMSVQDLVRRNADILYEIEINPLICLPEGAVAADALIRMGEVE